MENGKLQHHGIKGMRWGRRRYQNHDGSLTPAGKQRYNDGPDDVEQLSDQELRNRINRINMERQYRDLTKRQKSVGEKFVTDVLVGAGKQVATQYAAKYLTKGIEGLLSKKGGGTKAYTPPTANFFKDGTKRKYTSPSATFYK